MHSTRQFKKTSNSTNNSSSHSISTAAMTQEKPSLTNNKAGGGGGIAIQSSAPLYTHKHQDHQVTQHQEHTHDHQHETIIEKASCPHSEKLLSFLEY